jgi:hypothetical protein
MPVRARIAVGGFSDAEAIAALPSLREELEAREWLKLSALSWDAGRKRIVVVAQMEGDDPRVEGGVGGAIYDNVWDCIFATMPSNGSDWTFDVEESTCVAAA